MYTPSIAPTDTELLPQFLSEQLILIAAALAQSTPQTLRLQVSDQQPPKPTDGDLVYFPANDYDPGSGAGLYFRSGSTWNFIV